MKEINSLSEIINEYSLEVERFSEKRDIYEKNVQKHEALISKYEKLIESHKEKIEKLSAKKPKRINFVKEVVQPLVRIINDKLSKGHRYEILGPYGLNGNILVKFIPGDCDEYDYKYINLIPCLEERKIYYLTDKPVPNPYKEGSIGYYNHQNFEEAELPDDINSILNILKTYKKS
ncbi:hypothetical protein BFS06_14280 [Clostridium perfringens]|uniref:Uncharacterized protein n=1 Tax=Clostridium perfringens TaxID=1502 RepID=A0A140GRF7_CLOPF|nr:hypothetical protein [Clostridium perfringens]AMN31116.1 hypothetical protein JFP838_pA0200 [Clostridium perfringens]TBX14373.1 hypothetical protein BFS06_14280 [Clostridium perfringens]